MVLLGMGLAMLFLHGCDDDKQGLEITFPNTQQTTWQYNLFELNLEDTTRVGEIYLVNVEKLSYEGRADILRQRKFRLLDSLQNSPDSVQVFSTYLDLNQKFQFDLFADDFYGMFETMLNERVMDTLTAQNRDGDDYQEFFDFEPGWVPFAVFDQGSNVSYKVHRQERFFLDFYLRDHHITGHVDLFTSGLFTGFDRLNTPLGDSVFTYRFKQTSYMDFSLQRDSVTIPPFRETLSMTTWLHPDAGIIKRTRSPFALNIPSIPSRGPAIFDPGEMWKLQNIEGFDFSEITQ